MRHRRKPKQLSKYRNRDRATLKNQAVSLILHEKIKTTKTRAKILQRVVEKLVTTAKAQNLLARRKLIAYLPKAGAARKLMEELAVRYKERPGGYTRVLKIGPRGGDGAEMARIEFV
jgi:large subunit ribosomal protein L17